ncbi:MAG: hypothetical protein VX148_13210 [Pseudomonadota bacterium]|nr:hypothetical protein [Pseudomonadota bacterium]
MKFSLVGLLAYFMTGCALLSGSSSQPQQIYYAPMILSDRPSYVLPNVHPVYRSDRLSGSVQGAYRPVIAD